MTRAVADLLSGTCARTSAGSSGGTGNDYANNGSGRAEAGLVGPQVHQTLGQAAQVDEQCHARKNPHAGRPAVLPERHLRIARPRACMLIYIMLLKAMLMLASAIWAAKADVAVKGIHTDTEVAILQNVSARSDGKFQLLQERDDTHELATAAPLHAIEAKPFTTKGQEYRGRRCGSARGGGGGGHCGAAESVVKKIKRH